jgi:alginate O-acetyltransferase complex protein AlgI
LASCNAACLNGGMVFSSVSFLFFFLLLFFAGYLAAPGVTAKNAVLLVGSLMFYAWGEPWFVLVLVTQIVFNHAIALAIDRRDGKSRGSATALGHPD